MSVDPYHAVQQEIQNSLQTAAQLQSSFLRIRNMAREDSEELMWARNELKATLATLEADLEDLEESVKIVESTDARMFGLDDAEVQKRRRYVGHVRKEIETTNNVPSEVQNMRANVSSSPSASQPSGSGTQLHAISPRAGPGSPFSERYGDDHQSEWARQEQQIMLQQQDHTMDSIAGTLNTLAQQASLMGQEIEEHNEMLTDLEANVDRSDQKLNDAMRRMRKFLRDSEEKGSGWCIIILMIVLMALLLAVILV
ncbi:Syntaxin-6 [Psilocybe cubensis]|uniref:Syntaxin-6 n=2 Tax=Psilocybe cubensis TaxID=181762 RepID=A0ACB8GS04_PSICU|nr:Syntaxin-6 [Psilocybe cubensis]KAH9478510.1 Syntaxin-6 [Psilocybe cubensis]